MIERHGEGRQSNRKTFNVKYIFELNRQVMTLSDVKERPFYNSDLRDVQRSPLKKENASPG